MTTFLNNVNIVLIYQLSMDIKTFNTVFSSINWIILFCLKHANKTNAKIHFLSDDDVIILAQLLFNYNALSCECRNNANTMNLLGFEIETVYYVQYNRIKSSIKIFWWTTPEDDINTHHFNLSQNINISHLPTHQHQLVHQATTLSITNHQIKEQ